jgi:hypothetical protein
MAEGLTAVVKSVTRGGTTFDETYWVRTEQLRKNIDEMHKLGVTQVEQQHSAFMRTVKVVGGDGKKAVDWAESYTHAGQHTETRVKTDEGETVVSSSSTETLTEMTKVAHNEVTGQHEPTLEAMASVSQAVYQSDEVEVYRGVYNGQAQQVLDAIAKNGEAELGLHDLVSFTEKIHTAKQYCEGHGTGGPNDEAKTKPHIIVRTRVPRSSIVMSWRAVPSLDAMHEHEVTLLGGGSIKIKKEDVWGYNDPSMAESVKPQWAAEAEARSAALPETAAHS